MRTPWLGDGFLFGVEFFAAWALSRAASSSAQPSQTASMPILATTLRRKTVAAHGEGGDVGGGDAHAGQRGEETSTASLSRSAIFPIGCGVGRRADRVAAGVAPVFLPEGLERLARGALDDGLLFGRAAGSPARSPGACQPARVEREGGCV